MFDELFEKIVYETLTNDQRLTSVEKEYADWKIVGLESRVLQLGQRAADLRLKVIGEEDRIRSFKDVPLEQKLTFAKSRLEFWTELSNYDSNNKYQMDRWNGIVQELEGQLVVETKEVKEVRIVGESSNNEVAEVDKYKLLDAIEIGLSKLNLGYWFSGEKEVDGKQVFEYSSSRAPKIELIVHGKIVK